MKLEGWVKLYRKVKDTKVFKNDNLWRFWTWCLMSVEYEPTTVMVGYTEVTLQPGQMLFGKPGRRLAALETGLSDQTIKTCIKTLSSGPNPYITEKSTRTYTVLTLLNSDICKSGQPAANPVVTRSQPADNPEATREEPATGHKLPPKTPIARAPTREKEEELQETTHTNNKKTAVCDSKSKYQHIYEFALHTYLTESGVAYQDANTKEGAKILAQAVLAGELKENDIPVIVKNGIRDSTLKNQSYRGIARNFGKYLSKEPIETQINKYPIVAYVCEECGYVYRTYWRHDYDPSPIQCNAHVQEFHRKICKGHMNPNKASIRASPDKSNGVSVA